MNASPRPEWDTPADGDFARYVEQLVARQAADLQAAGHLIKPAHVLAETGGVVPHLDAPGTPSAPAGHAAPPAHHAPLLSLLSLQAARALRLAVGVLPWLVALQAVALLGFGRGSLFVLMATVLLWMALRPLLAGVARLQSRSPESVAAAVTVLQQRLRALAQQGRNGPHK